jgi:hypothetical protein
MPAIKVGVREFREQIARFLESDTPVAATRHGGTPSRSMSPRLARDTKTADPGELKAAAARLADVSEDKIAADFQAWRGNKSTVPQPK